MTPAERRIRDIISRDGPITVARFMDIALADPEHGYYRTRDPLGAAGDFVTAPEVSQMFGELIGLWCAATWRQAAEPTPARLVELGPGRGTLMADALRAIGQAMPAFRRALSVHLVETSRALRERQAAALADEDAHWHETFAAVPDGPAFVIANEFFDALPIAQYVWRGGLLAPRLVGLDREADRLQFVEGKPAAPPPIWPAGQTPGPDGAVQELGPAAAALAESVAARIAAQGGAAVIVDYGYRTSQPGETLQAVRAHEYHDVLEEPGEADLTAHVDFEALGRAIRAGGARPHGPVEQGLFLRRLGIDARRDALAANADGRGRADLAAAHRRLTHPDEMGLLYQAMAITRRGDPVPPGFSDGADAAD